MFVDLVSTGQTFGNLLDLLEHWAQQTGMNTAALRKRVSFVGITERRKKSPNTWRWYQQAA